MWSKVTSFLGGNARVIGALLGGPAGAAVGALVSSALGTDNNPDAVYAKLQSDPNALAKVLELEITHASDLRRLHVEAEANRLAADTARIQAVNATMQAEAATGKSGWRDWWGYISAVCFGVEILAVIAAVLLSVFMPGVDASNVTPALVAVITALTTMWGLPLAVLGISAWHAGAADRIQLGDTTLSAALAKRNGNAK